VNKLLDEMLNVCIAIMVIGGLVVGLLTALAIIL